MKKFFTIAGLVLLICLIIIYGVGSYYFYENQNQIFFQPNSMPKDFVYEFNATGGYPEFESSKEQNLVTNDGISINTALIKVKNSKGVVIYLHQGNAKFWNFGTDVIPFAEKGYDILMLDYRGYGKSEGSITNENELNIDAQTGYNYLKTLYTENQIIIYGKKLGAAPAVYLAANNNPKKLILENPFYNASDWLTSKFILTPTILLKNKFSINEILPKVKAAVVIFHGKENTEVPFSSSEKLSKIFKPGDILIPFDTQINYMNSSDPDSYNFNNTQNYKMKIREIID
jgi:uncharacterized protein